MKIFDQSILAVFAWMALTIFPVAGRAQVVEVGPGFVRAPFVDVEWGHGVHVRAPFVDICTSECCHTCAATPRGVYGAAAPIGYMRRDLTAAAEDLNQALAGFDTGAGWQQYLMVSQGQTLSPEELARASVLNTLPALARALARFDAASKNSEYGVITHLPSFAATHDLLAEYIRRLTPLPKPEEVPRPRAS